MFREEVALTKVKSAKGRVLSECWLQEALGTLSPCRLALDRCSPWEEQQARVQAQGVQNEASDALCRLNHAAHAISYGQQSKCMAGRGLLQRLLASR